MNRGGMSFVNCLLSFSYLIRMRRLFISSLVSLILLSACKKDNLITECTLVCIADSWTLERMIGSADTVELLPSGSKPAVLTLTTDEHTEQRTGLYAFPYLLSGTAPVNTFNGTFNSSINGFLEVSRIATTYIGGPMEWIDFETRYLQALRHANRFEAFEDDRLIIYADSLETNMFFTRE